MNCTYHPMTEARAFCQHCGRPLCQECIRQVGSSVYGPECYQSAQPGNAPGQAPPYGSVYTGPNPPVGSQPWIDQQVAQAMGGAYPPVGGGPSPGIAALLGFIPGVGAMYNGQFVKALIHVLVFTVLASFSDEFHPMGALCAAFIFYQVFEAYHTAKARRLGQPLPDPFRINELTARMGLGGHTPPSDPMNPPGAVPPPGVASGWGPASGAGWGPVSAGVYPPQPSGAVPPPPAGYGPQPPYPPPFPPPPPFQHRREPVAAIVLILLGALFLIGPLTHSFIHFGVPVFLIALGVWLVVKRVHGTQGGPQ